VELDWSSDDTAGAVPTYKLTSMSLYTPQSIMRPLSTAKHNQVLSLLSSGLSTKDIEHQAGGSKYTVSKVTREYEPDKENHPGGRPQKLTSMDKRVVLSFLLQWKLPNPSIPLSRSLLQCKISGMYSRMIT